MNTSRCLSPQGHRGGVRPKAAAKKRRAPQEEKEEESEGENKGQKITRLLEEGKMKPAEIAAEVGCNVNSVYAIKYKLKNAPNGSFP